MMTLYDYLPSGNGYKARLLLALCGAPYRLVELDILRGATRTPEFLALNPNGRIPLLQLEDGRLLSESDAILFLLAQDTRYWPDASYLQAQVLQWMFFEQYNHEPNIATARYWLAIRGTPLNELERGMLEAKQRAGNAALALMEQRLGQSAWLVGDGCTIADLALYAYTHVAEEGGGFGLGPFPSIRAWLTRIEALPGYVRITDRPG